MTETDALEISESLKQEAKEQDEIIRKLYQSMGQSWIELGLRCTDVQDRHLHVYLGFASFGDWLEDVGIRRSTAYEAMGVVQRLNTLPISDLSEMTKENAKQLLRLPESGRDTEAIENAKQMKENDFTAFVESQLSGIEVEPMVRRMLVLPRSLAERFDKAITIAMYILENEGGKSTRESGLEQIISNFLLENEAVYEAEVGGFGSR